MSESTVFCDWLSMYQIHSNSGELPILNGGQVIKVSAPRLRQCADLDSGCIVYGMSGEEIEYTSASRIEHEGSYETKIQLRCDGSKVEISGNLGRFGRPDNLFGVGVLECVEIANRIVTSLGLPPFEVNAKRGGFAFSQTHTKTRAVITRVDLTCNYATGSTENASRVLTVMAGQAPKRMGKNAAPKAYSNGITWNEGSRRWYEKLYFKADDLGKFASPEVVAYCRDNGILRHEISLKSTELAERGLDDVCGWARVEEGRRMENVIYGRFAEKLHRNEVSITSLDDIPGRIGEVAASYYAGRDVWRDETKTKRTRQMWRKALLPFGIDISQPPNIQHFAARIRVVEMVPAAVPHWYKTEAA